MHGAFCSLCAVLRGRCLDQHGRQQQACILHAGQGHIGAAYNGMNVTVALLASYNVHRGINEEERLRALRRICSAMLRTAQALPEQVRQLSHAQADKRAAPRVC